MNNAVTAYCKQVRRRLACVPQMRAHTLPQLEDALLDYTAEHPQADFAALCARFGTPGQFAENTLANMDGAQLARQMNRYRWRNVLVAVVIVLTVGYVFLSCGKLAINWANQPETYTVIGSAYEIDGPIPSMPPQ